MITLTSYTYTYPAAAAPALRDVSLHVPHGAFALVVGASGSGKSTLLRTLNGLVPHFSGGTVSGSVSVAGLDPLSVGPGALSRHVGFVFQDPEAQAVTDTVADEVAFALEQAGVPPAVLRQRVLETLDLLELRALHDRRLDTLSGGERQRVAVAAVLVTRPALLILDEPTSQLDPESAAALLDTLVWLRAALGLTVVLAEHRVERVLPYTDMVIQVDPGGSMRSGDPAAILRDSPFAPPVLRLAAAFGWEPPPLTVSAALPFVRGDPGAPGASGGDDPAGRDDPAGGTGRDDPPGRLYRPILELRNVTVNRDNRAILRDIDLVLRPGELLALMGRNGAGKTTLLRTIVGLLRPSSGAVLLRGEPTAALSVAQICREVAYLPQDPSALLFAETVREELEATLRNHGLFSPAPAGFDRLSRRRRGGTPSTGSGVREVRDIPALLAALGLGALAERYPRDLSVGERQRVALGAVTVTAPPLLLLDEPTRGLDALAKRALAALLTDWRTAGAAILLVSHDAEFVAQVATRAALLAAGAPIDAGPPQRLLGAGAPFATQTAQLFPATGHLTPERLLG